MTSWLLLSAALAASPATPPAASVVAPHEALPVEPVADDPDLPKAGGPVLSFRLRALNPELQGQFIGIDSMVGSDRDDEKAKLVVLSFMASYCKPCKKEMPYLQKLYARYKDQGLRVVMVAVDTDEAGQAAVAQLIKANGVTFPVLKDIGGLTSRRFLGQRTPLPSLFVVGADGNIQSVKRGYDEKGGEVLLSEVQKGLGQAAEALR
jgi:thiol-disulfide isomerase/thioredoxin